MTKKASTAAARTPAALTAKAVDIALVKASRAVSARPSTFSASLMECVACSDPAEVREENFVYGLDRVLDGLEARLSVS
jgi:hypothetical protein